MLRANDGKNGMLLEMQLCMLLSSREKGLQENRFAQIVRNCFKHTLEQTRPRLYHIGK